MITLSLENGINKIVNSSRKSKKSKMVVGCGAEKNLKILQISFCSFTTEKYIEKVYFDENEDQSKYQSRESIL